MKSSFETSKRPVQPNSEIQSRKTFRVRNQSSQWRWLTESLRSTLIFAIVTLTLVSALDLSYGQSSYVCTVAPSQISPTPNFTTSQNSSNTDYTISLEQQMRSLDSNVDSAKAISLAQSSRQFQAAASGHQVQFESIFFLFGSTVNSHGASIATFESVNVVFFYHDTAPWAHIVVTLDPALTQVVKVTIQPAFVTSHPPLVPLLGTC